MGSGRSGGGRGPGGSPDGRPCLGCGHRATLSPMDRLWLAYLALALGLMGFGALWGWLGAR
ncbi:MAG TPA: hypothetical protein VLA62_13340, partial [Solirubrobacterales bacterium]|nr:hypothetical protein [Solirubrobacterales bacterium]